MSGSSRHAGFTLTEVVIVMVLLAIVAVFVAPRLFTGDSKALQFAEESLALVRYAHKLAMASGCAVRVEVTAGAGGGVALRFTGAGGCPAGPVPDPADGSAASATAPGGTAVSGPTFTFDPLGNPGGNVVIVISGAASRTIRVTNNTGFVVSS